jgi:two-component sensor histidine kinase
MHGGENASRGLERLVAALGAVTPAVFDYDLVSGRLEISPGLRALYGIAAEDIFGVPAFLERAHEEDRPAWQSLFDPAHEAEPTRLLRYRLPAADRRETRYLTAEIITTYTDGRPVALTATIRDDTEQRRAATALMESEERLRLAIEAGRMAVWEVDLATGRLTNSPELNILLGFPVDAVITLADVRELYAPGEMERLAQEGVLYEQVRGKAVGGAAAVRRDWRHMPEGDRTEIQVDFAIICPDGTPRHLLLRAQHAPALDNIGQRVTGVLVDITDRKLAEDRLAIVARELQHRVKNSLTIVQAIAAQSFRDVDDQPAMHAFSGRVQALAAVTDAILQGGATEAPLTAVIARIVDPYRTGSSDPFTLSGPEVALPSRLATSVSMALHELCTNAVKYGALSVPEGRVALSWAVDDGVLAIDWREDGGPPVKAPTHAGFGTRLLRSLVGRGEVATTFDPQGVRSHLRLPLGTSG